MASQSTSRADRFKIALGVDLPSPVSDSPPQPSGSSRGRAVDKSPDAPRPTSVDADLGMPAQKGMRFCPILAVAKFPYKYIPKRYMDTVSDKFFNKDKFWEREWDLYSVWSPHYDSGKPYLFIPLTQFEALVKEIDAAFPSYLITCPPDAEEQGLIVTFDSEDSEFRPKWLGRSSSKYEYSSLESKVELLDMPSHKPSEASTAAFKQKMQDAIDATKQKNKVTRDRKKQEREIKNLDIARTFKRAQRYLGLRPRTTSDDALARDTSPELRPVDVTKPAPYAFDCDVIIIAVDAEAWEEHQGTVTEVGIATLDTRDIRDIAPGPNGVNWRDHIRARHLRISEYTHLVNHKFVSGCPENFEFGTSEFIPRNDVARTVATCFKPPYSQAAAPTHSTGPTAPDKRNIIFLGHDTQNDIAYLAKIGYNVHNLANLLETMDTSAMHRAFAHEPNPRSLGHVCMLLDIDAWHLHNAGNDAVYTVQAMLGLCVKHAVEQRGARGRALTSRDREKALEDEVARATLESETRVREQAAGWAAVEADTGDGGLAYRMKSLKITAKGTVLDI